MRPRSSAKTTGARETSRSRAAKARASATVEQRIVRAVHDEEGRGVRGDVVQRRGLLEGPAVVCELLLQHQPLDEAHQPCAHRVVLRVREVVGAVERHGRLHGSVDLLEAGLELGPVRR